MTFFSPRIPPSSLLLSSNIPVSSTKKKRQASSSEAPPLPFSSQAKTKPLPPPLYRPKLYLPQTNYALEILQVSQKQEALSNIELKQSTAELASDTARFREWNQQALQALQDHAKEFESQKTWNALSHVAQYIGFLTTSLAGIGCLTAGGISAGVCLIAAGVIGMTHRAVSDTCGWEALVGYFISSEELQKKVASHIEIGLPYASIALTLVGTIGAWQVGVFALSEEILRSSFVRKTISKAASILLFTNVSLGIGAQLLNAFHQKRLKLIESELRFFETASSNALFQMERQGEFTKDAMELTQLINNIVKKILAELQN